MTVSGTRGAARKPARKNIRFGHKLVNVLFGTQNTVFAVHEDLLCSSSQYFKRKLQKSRKPVEGECSICTEKINDLTKVSYCKGCGQNFHTKCIDGWLQRERTCPLCRLRWPLPLQPVEEVIADVPLKGLPDGHFDRYMQWLYTGLIPQDDVTVARLMTAQALGEDLEDPLYVVDVRRNMLEILSNTQAMITCEKLLWFYVRPKYVNSRNFLVDLCANCPSLLDLTVDLPPQFLIDLTHNLLSRRSAGDVIMRQALMEHIDDDEEEHKVGAEN